MSFQKISDIEGNDNITHGKSLEIKIDVKKLTKRDGAFKPDVVNMLQNGNTDEEDRKLLKDRSVNVDIKHNNKLEDKFDAKGNLKDQTNLILSC